MLQLGVVAFVVYVNNGSSQCSIQFLNKSKQLQIYILPASMIGW